jgi:hypothetical protein
MRAFIDPLLRRLVAGLLACVAAASAVSAATVTRIENGRPGTATFLLQGSIEAGDLRRMTEALDRLPIGTVASVILESPGGLVTEGLALGALFHRAKVTTIVKGDGAICYSACALAFLGGRDARTGKPMRVKMSGGKLGFHQFRRNYDPLKIYTKADYDAEVARAQRTTGMIVNYMKEIGEDLTKLQLMLRAPSESMNVISNEECLERGFHILDEASGRLVEAGTKLPQRVSALN